ncbi:MAG: hypothetical protein MSB08_08420 [Subdoligranulum sp.]|nr:hypothetical protein [Subdoligranulum sp.]
MKMRYIMALCGAMAFVLAGCGSEVVESAVTETQVIDVNEPSAVEQAMEQQDVAFVDETESIVAFEKEYAAKAPANDKEIGEKSQQVLEAAQEQFFYWCVAKDDVCGAWAANEALQYNLEEPDETCITPQQAANAAGRAANAAVRAAKKVQPDMDVLVYMISLRLSDPEQPGNSRLVYQMEVTQQGEAAQPRDRESVCAFRIDAVTGGLVKIYKYEEAFALEEDTNLEGFAQKGQAELQGYLDALGAGQTCTAFENMDKMDEKSAQFTTNIDGAPWDVCMYNGLILYAQPAPMEG